MDEPDLNQTEDTQISSALDVEKLDANLYRSVNLWSPPNARGVFGGQVISQAIVSATNCVDPAYGLHSLHCYFILNASPALPIHYHVDRVRGGRTYTTRAVRAIQNGRVVFILLCSFQKPEPWQPARQHTMPNVPPPESCEDEDVTYRRLAVGDGLDQITREYFLQKANERMKSPIAVRKIGDHVQEDIFVTRYWMRAKNIPKTKCEPAYQKCILGYMSDVHFIVAAPRSLGMKAGLKNAGDGPGVLGLVSTLDHAIWFYNDDFDCGDWILYEIQAPHVSSGRGIVFGRMFTREGALITYLSQEGVVRARVRGPDDGEKGKSKSKL